MRNKYVITIHILSLVGWFLTGFLHLNDIGGGAADLLSFVLGASAIVFYVWTIVNMYLTGNRPRRSPARERLDM